MKKSVTAVLAAILTLASLCSCSVFTNTKAVKPSRGTVDGNVYHSDYSKITLTVPENWYFYTDDEISQLVGATVDIMKLDNAKAEAISKAAMDFFVADPETGDNISLTYEKVSPLVSQSTYIDAFTRNSESSYVSAGGSASYKEDGTVTLSAKTYQRITGDLTLSGMDMKQYVYVRKIGDYFLAVVFTVVSGTTAEQVEAMFS